MNISDKKKRELYSVIHEQVMQVRIKRIEESINMDEDTTDNRLSNLADDIWEQVCITLNIKD